MATGKGRGGGVLLMAVSTSYDCVRVFIPGICESDCESVWLTAVAASLRSNKNKISIGVFYIPPSTSLDVYERVCNAITTYLHQLPASAKILITGDFNAPSFNVSHGHSQLSILTNTRYTSHPTGSTSVKQSTIN